MEKLKDTMMMAIDYEKMVDFYNKFIGLEITEKTDQWTTLFDRETGQTLCITNGPSVKSTSPGVEVDNLEESLKKIEILGGTIHKRWEYGAMKGANCRDPENNEIMVWQGSH